jgi:K+-transporting ATPase KdpF subunit
VVIEGPPTSVGRLAFLSFFDFLRRFFAPFLTSFSLYLSIEELCFRGGTRYVGFSFHRLNASLLGDGLGVIEPLRSSHGGEAMSPLYLMAGLITLVLLIYLVLALLKPEWFG